MAYCFISDLHLHEGRPDITQAFLTFLEETASKAEKLYILGDLLGIEQNQIDKIILCTNKFAR